MILKFCYHCQSLILLKIASGLIVFRQMLKNVIFFVFKSLIIYNMYNINFLIMPTIRVILKISKILQDCIKFNLSG